MIEESVEGFIQRYRPYAAPVEVLPHLEGSPLLECVLGTTVVQVLERTAPYLARPGRMRLILNPTAASLTRSAEGRKELLAPALGRIRATGLVLGLEERVLIVDAGAPLVVSLETPAPADLTLGEWVAFESTAPIHGFVLPPEPQRGRALREGDADSI